MSKSVPTLNGIRFYNARAHGRDLDIPEFTTINEQLPLASVVPHQPAPTTRGMQTAEDYNFTTDSQNVFVRYLAIGNRGHFAVNNGEDFKNYDKLATMNGLYGMIPWVVRPANNDLSQSERARYRLRKTMLIAGQLYAAYYLLVIDFGAAIEQNTVTTVNGGIENTYTHVPSQSDLTPTPFVAPISPDNDGSFASSSLIVTIDLTQELQNVRDACALVYGDENKAIISEMAVCSGVDKPVTIAYSDSTTPAISSVPAGAATEAVAVQIVSHIVDCFYVLRTFNTLSITIDVGGSEPLYGTQ